MNLDEYLNKIDKIINKILIRKNKELITFDLLDTKKTIELKRELLREKQKQMKIGEIWQEVIGNYNGYINLKSGHKSGLDIISIDKKIIIELKNRTNTDNYSSRKTNFDKLAKFKKENPEFICIYANINEKTEKATLEGNHKIIIHNNVEIHIYTGLKFLNLIFDDKLDIILEYLKVKLNQ